MNLHGIVRGAVATINPETTATIQASSGYATDPSGRRTPLYDAPFSVTAQVQALEERDIFQADALTIAGATHKVYLSGDLSSLVRPENKGGDILTLADGTTWLVKAVLEHWPDWTAAAITRQNQ